MNAPAEEGEAHAKVSKRENRLYIGNLAYDCNYKDLEKFMSGCELSKACGMGGWKLMGPCSGRRDFILGSLGHSGWSIQGLRVSYSVSSDLIVANV